MNLAALLRHEAEVLSRMAHKTKDLDEDFSRDHGLAAATLGNIAGISEVHGLAGVHGYLACLRYGHAVTDGKRNLVIETVDRILRGGR